MDTLGADARRGRALAASIGIPLGILAGPRATRFAARRSRRSSTSCRSCRRSPTSRRSSLFFGIGAGAAADRDAHLRDPAGHPDHGARHPRRVRRRRSRPPARWAPRAARCCARSSCRWPAARSAWPQPDDHDGALDGRHHGPDRRPGPRARRSSGRCPDAERRRGLRRRARDRRSWPSCSTGSPSRASAGRASRTRSAARPRAPGVAGRSLIAGVVARRRVGRRSPPRQLTRRRRVPRRRCDVLVRRARSTPLVDWIEPNLSCAHRRRSRTRHRRAPQPAAAVLTAVAVVAGSSPASSALAPGLVSGAAGRGRRPRLPRWRSPCSGSGSTRW